MGGEVLRARKGFAHGRRACDGDDCPNAREGFIEARMQLDYAEGGGSPRVSVREVGGWDGYFEGTHTRGEQVPYVGSRLLRSAPAQAVMGLYEEVNLPAYKRRTPARQTYKPSS